MKKSNRLWSGIVAGGLSLALVSGIGLQVSVRAADANNFNKMRMEHRQEMRAMGEKMLAQAKSEDAALEKLITELNQAPEDKKVDLEAAILNKLVQQHHQMLAHLETLHARNMQFRKECMQKGAMGKNGTCKMPGMMNESTPPAPK